MADNPMVHRSLKLALAGALLLSVAACMGDRMQTPPFYEDMARVDGVVDAATAAQMISQYRINNGLSPVIADPQLIMLDEPSLGLAPMVVEEIFSIVLRNQGV